MCLIFKLLIIALLAPIVIPIAYLGSLWGEYSDRRQWELHHKAENNLPKDKDEFHTPRPL